MIDEATLASLLSEAEAEVGHRLRRQPYPKPQFVRGVQSGVRWYMEAVQARIERLAKTQGSEEINRD
ncbi:MAG: hypothetical protein ABR507_04295 [Actinomycetota bacterium]|nr:hypothetical protein [Actinomycetota bacterium]